MIDEFKQKVVDLLKKELNLKKVELTKPPSAELGDFSFPCYPLSRQFKKNPIEIAKELSVRIKPKGVIKQIKEAGPYLNFFLDKQKIAERVLKSIYEKKERFGISSKKTGRIILVEYPGPNTNKPLHLGHVRNMALGYCLVKLLKAAGHKAIPVNIYNDRGVHICKSMLAYKKWGNGDTPETVSYTHLTLPTN